MPYSSGIKATMGRSKTTMEVPISGIIVEDGGGSTSTVGRVLNYTTATRTIPIMHRAFKNLEEWHVSQLVSLACNISRKAGYAENRHLRVLDIGFGLGYSAKAFYLEGVGEYVCVEINENIYNDALNWQADPIGYENENATIAIPSNTPSVSIANSSWQDFVAENATDNFRSLGFDIIYYSINPDEFGNMALFSGLAQVARAGTILSIQGYPLFDQVSATNYNTINLSGSANPDSNTYDSVFTSGLFNGLNNKGYFNVYYQYYNCATPGSGGGAPICADCPPIGGAEPDANCWSPSLSVEADNAVFQGGKGER
jgi:hypothetical protein